MNEYPLFHNQVLLFIRIVILSDMRKPCYWNYQYRYNIEYNGTINPFIIITYHKQQFRYSKST